MSHLTNKRLLLASWSIYNFWNFMENWEYKKSYSLITILNK